MQLPVFRKYVGRQSAFVARNETKLLDHQTKQTGGIAPELVKVVETQTSIYHRA